MILVNNELDAQFFMYVYFYPLHVSGSHVPIIRSIIVSMRHLVYVTLCRWPCGMLTAHSIQVFLASHGIPVVQQPPYSPDMAPCDFWLFPQLKTVLKGKRFEDVDAIKKNVTSTLNTFPKDSFKKCFQQWQDRWKQCISSQGEYFENY